MSCGNGFLGAPVCWLRGISLFAFGLLLSSSVCSPVSQAGRATTTVSLALEAKHAIKTLSHGTSYSNRWPLQQMQHQVAGEMEIETGP